MKKFICTVVGIILVFMIVFTIMARSKKDYGFEKVATYEDFIEYANDLKVMVYNLSASEMKEPAVSAEPEFAIAPAPREQTGSPDVMWNTIVDTIAREDRSFVSLVGRHSRGTEFDSGELIVKVRPNKIKLAEDKLGDITRMARGLYGQDVFVTLKAGDPDEEPGRAETVSEQETTQILEEDVSINDVAADIEGLFGIKPEITG